MLRILRDQKISTAEEYFSKICDCLTCKSLIKSDDVINEFIAYGETLPSTFKRGSSLVTMSFATSETKDKSLKHYLSNKTKEFKLLDETSLSDIKKNLNDNYEKFNDHLSDDKISYLLEWIAALD
jgi:hypothetical protein